MYAKLNNGNIEKYPYTIGDLRKDNPQCSFPRNITQDVLDQFGVVPVQAVTRPVLTDPAQEVIEIMPENRDGTWYQVYDVITLDPAAFAEKKASEEAFMRSARNQKLAESDWTQVADAPVDKTAWATYRQALREVPQQAGFPWNVVWPAKP